jgi:hypothetical protein
MLHEIIVVPTDRHAEAARRTVFRCRRRRQES